MYKTICNVIIAGSISMGIGCVSLGTNKNYTKAGRAQVYFPTDNKRHSDFIENSDLPNSWYFNLVHDGRTNKIKVTSTEETKKRSTDLFNYMLQHPEAKVEIKSRNADRKDITIPVELIRIIY